MYGGKSNLYLIRCFNENEDFYKVGITVHNDIRRRYTKSTIPYDYDVVDIIPADVRLIVDAETDIHKVLKPYRYSPELEFGGSVRECISKDGLETALKEFEKMRRFK